MSLVAIIEQRFPTNVAYGYVGGDMFSTERVRTGAGFVAKNARWSLPLRKFQVDTTNFTQAQWAALNAFLKAVGFGGLNNWRFRDWEDYCSDATGITPDSVTALDQPIGVGDSATTIFQLSKTYIYGGSSLVLPIYKPVSGTVLIGVSGSPVGSGWTVDATTGLVTFASAPTTAAAITAGFQYDIAAEFDDDYSPASYEDFSQVNAKGINITEVRLA